MSPTPTPNAARKALQEKRVLPISSLVHGAYYDGLLDNDPVVGRWHAVKRWFVFWKHNMGSPQSASARHVSDVRNGTCFAPLALRQSTDGPHISDFAFETSH